MQATVVDKCEGCGPDDIDLSPSAFTVLAPKAKGRIQVTLELLIDNPLEKRTCATFCSPVRRVFSVLIKRHFGKCVLHNKGLQYERCEYFHPVRKKFRTPHRSLVHSAGFRMERFGKLQDEQRKIKIKSTSPRRGAGQDTAERNSKDT